MTSSGAPSRVLSFVVDNSLLLVAGTLAALAWANVGHESYERFAHATHFFVNDIGMVFFFGLAAKEVAEAMLPGGALHSPRRSAVPLLAASGGMIVPALMYVALSYQLGLGELARGWAIPCATDIAFSYLAARIIFGPSHPAIPFLLLLAIADDALGLLILAVFYPSGEIAPVQFALLFAPALVSAAWLRRKRVLSFWPYVAVSGAVSWLALFQGGLHPALALVPIVPFMPHSARDVEHVGPQAPHRDTMNEFEHWWKVPVQVILFFFGLVNAGVPLSMVGPGTWIVLVSLVAGKPIGVWVFTEAASLIGLERAPALTSPVLFIVGCAAGIGFTVSLFFATAAFPPGEILDQAKMGALLSFVAAPLAFLIAAVTGVRRRRVA